jgi:hypothetical protein
MNDTSYEQKIMLWGSQMLAILSFVLLAFALSVDHFKTITVTGNETTPEERAPTIINGLAQYYSVPSAGIRGISCAAEKLHYKPINGNSDIPYSPQIPCDYQSFMALQSKLENEAKQVPQPRTLNNPSFNFFVFAALFFSLASIAIASALGLERNKIIKSLKLDIDLSDPASYILQGLVISLALLSTLRSTNEATSSILIVLTMITILGQMLFHAMLPVLHGKAHAPSTIQVQS